MMQIGELLGMSIASVRELPASEITLWVAYFKLKNKPKEEPEPVGDLEGFKRMMR